MRKNECATALKWQTLSLFFSPHSAQVGDVLLHFISTLPSAVKETANTLFLPRLGRMHCYSQFLTLLQRNLH